MEPSEKGGPKDVNFGWTQELMKSLIDICLNYLSRNGKSHPYKWNELAIEFEKVNGKKCNRSTLKNKYDGMKKDWRIWKSLKRGETGLGWDPTTQKITADADWWNMKIKEQPLCKKFRNKGIPPEIEDLWDLLYGDNTATGEHCVAPSMSSSRVTGNQPVEVEGDNALGYDLDSTDPHFFGSFLDSLDPSHVEGTQQEHMAKVLTNSDKMMHLYEAEATDVTQKLESTVDDGLRVLADLVNSGDIIRLSPLWCFVVTTIKDTDSRDMFMKLEDSSTRVAWLNWEFSNHGA